MDGSTESPNTRSCPWCSAVAAEDATRCPACGAALAQRDSIADLVIPGVTTVDPALAALAAQPLRIGGASPSQGMAAVLFRLEHGQSQEIEGSGGMPTVERPIHTD